MTSCASTRLSPRIPRSVLDPCLLGSPSDATPASSAKSHPAPGRGGLPGGPGGGRVRWPADEADVAEGFGADAHVYGRTRFGDSEQQIIARVDGRNSPAKGDSLHVRPRRGHVHLFRVPDGARLAS